MKNYIIIPIVLWGLTACQKSGDACHDCAYVEKKKNPDCLRDLNNFSSAKDLAKKAFQLQGQCGLTEVLMLEALNLYDIK